MGLGFKVLHKSFLNFFLERGIGGVGGAWGAFQSEGAWASERGEGQRQEPRRPFSGSRETVTDLGLSSWNDFENISLLTSLSLSVSSSIK